MRLSIAAEAELEPGDIVWVPFPFVEEPLVRERPAVVVGVPPATAGIQLLWVIMITSAANRGWRGDVSLETRFAECGLRVPCVVRTAKIATVELRKSRRTGALPSDLLDELRAELAKNLA